MALPSSGQLTLNQIHIEAGGSSGTQVTLNDTDVRGLISKGSGAQNAISEYYGASSAPAHTDELSDHTARTDAYLLLLAMISESVCKIQNKCYFCSIYML